jgi:hypothetical protein
LECIARNFAQIADGMIARAAAWSLLRLMICPEQHMTLLSPWGGKKGNGSQEIFALGAAANGWRIVNYLLLPIDYKKGIAFAIYLKPECILWLSNRNRYEHRGIGSTTVCNSLSLM